ncbi:MAG: class I SAM-dependent RNA methyltransferase [Myxococcales bacterium]|nr:class I SAM-dependent RNA methyltransferase [Myxococcales bacterium]
MCCTATSTSPCAGGRPISSSRASEAPRVGDALELTVRRLGFGGDGIAHAPDGRVVLVRGAGPGDVVRARVSQVRKRHARAVVEARVADGPARVEPFCPRVDVCGGCPWQGIDDAVQGAALHAHVQRALDRAVGGSAPLLPLRAVAPRAAWRSTARLHWQDGRLGYYRAGGDLFDVPDCPVLAPPLDALFAAARRHLLPALRGQGALRLTGAPDAPSGTLTAAPDGATPPGLARALAAVVEAEPACHGAALVGPEGVRTFGDPVDALGPERVPHPAGTFVQAHQPGVQALAAEILERLRGVPSVLELYAGSGAFTFALAAAGHRVVAVESAPRAVEALRAAAAARGLSERVLARLGDAARLPPDPPRVALIDPPRKGAREAVAALHGAGVERLLYVACDPITLARDVAWLVERGWRMEQGRCFDLFPHTGHVETWVDLRRGAS